MAQTGIKLPKSMTSERQSRHEDAIPTSGTRRSSRICPRVPAWTCACDLIHVLVPHYAPGPRSLWRAKAGSSLGVTGCPMAVAGELAGRAITVRGAGLKAVGGLQTRGAGTCPTLGVTGAAVATAAGLVTLWSPHSRGTVCEMRRVEEVTRGLTATSLHLIPISVSHPPHTPCLAWP